MNELVSVIIPVYNVENYLEKCIQSVLNQTYKNFEMIIIDDGSTDKSGNICDEYSNKDKRIKVIHKKNAGVSMARNDGIASSSGTFLCFVDSDDYLENSFLELLLKNINGNDLVISNYKYVEENHKITNNIYNKKHIKTFNNGIQFIKEEICNPQKNSINFFSPWGKLYRSKIIKDNKMLFNSEISICEDHLFNLMYLKCSSKVKVLDKCLYYYRLTSNGLSKNSKNLFYYKNGNFMSMDYLYNTIYKNGLINRKMVTCYLLNRLMMTIKQTMENCKNEDTEIMNFIKKTCEDFKNRYQINIKGIYGLKNFIFYTLIKFHLYSILYYLLKIKLFIKKCL